MTPSRQLIFVSKNPAKQNEARQILTPLGIDVVADLLTINELQTVDTEALVRDKAMKAFRMIGRPLFVEHTGLYLDMLGGFPGGLTDIFWESLQKDRFAKLFASKSDRALAKTHIGYVDGRRIHIFDGEISGRIVRPRGNPRFQWDCVFEPEGSKKTFAEMGERKNDVSMRRIALEKLHGHLEKHA